MNPIKNKLFSLSLITILAIGIIGLSSWKAPQIKKAAADTTKKSKTREAHSSRKTIITFDEQGNPHEEIIEKFEGDNELKEMMLEDIHFDFDFPPIPDIDISIPGLPHDFIPPMNFEFNTDGFDGFHFNGDHLELLDGELEERFRDQFEAIGPEMEVRLKDMSMRLQEMDFQFDQPIHQNLDEQLRRMEERMRDLDVNLNDRLKDLNFNFDHMGFDPGRLHEISNLYTERLKEFEKEAQKELVKDGYLKTNERIESLSFSDDEIEFNGKAIKKEHQAKYLDLKEKYLQRKSNLGRIE
jgi:hypothetical protein